MENIELPVAFPQAPARPGPEVLPASKRKKRSRPVYRRLKRVIHPHTCDDCLAVSHRLYPNDPVPLKAKWERRVVGEDARFLCGPHAEQWHARDDPAGKPLEDQ